MNVILIKILIISLLIIFLSFTIILIIDWHVKIYGLKYIVNLENANKADAAIVPGAYVFPDGNVSDILGDRLKVAVDLYKAKKVKKLLVSGDHGKTTYDEVNAMRKYIQSMGIPREDIFMDHAGFSTYETLYRSRDIFKVETAIIVTQKYHLMRALYIARKLGIQAHGVTADKHIYYKMEYYKTREIAARFKDYLLVNILRPKPKYLGKSIPISGNGIATDDGTTSN